MGVYVVKPDGTTDPMLSVSCKNEDKELQCILEHNPDLLPGEQIDPDDPCRWMLVKREMPVLGWSIDFLFLDHNSVPTFVECKRYADTRSRREVIGQALEYVANAQREWSWGMLHALAEDTAKQRSKSLEDSIRDLQVGEFKSTEDFFAKAEENLRKAAVRIIFFLEQAPEELKRLVEFLNTQMIASDVLLVEARQYEKDGLRIVAPRLFGFTEQARRTKDLIPGARPSGKRIATDWATFAENAKTKGLSDSEVLNMRKVYDACEALSAEIAWGRGVATGSFSPKWSAIATSASPFSIYSNGKLEMHFGSLRASDRAQKAGTRLANEMKSVGLKLPEDYLNQWYTYEPSQWMPSVEGFINAVRHAIQDELAK